MNDIPGRSYKAAEVEAYKTILRNVLDQRPSGTRQRLATALGKNRSFISQISNPAYPMPIPAAHLATVFKVCHFPPAEKRSFLGAFMRAHPDRVKQVRGGPRLRSLKLDVFDFDDAEKNREFDELVRDAARRLAPMSRSVLRQRDISSKAEGRHASIKNLPEMQPAIGYRTSASPRLSTAHGVDDISREGGPKTDRIYADLKTMIVAGTLPPGARIDKRALCLSHSSSRVPITVAISRLAHEELVVVKPQHGSFVAPIRFDDIRQLMLLRLALETDAVAVLTANAGRRLYLEFAYRNLAYQKAALAMSDLRRFYELDVEMHRTMIAHSGLTKFNHILDEVGAHLDRVGRLMQTLPGNVDESLSENELIVDAIASGRPSKAAEAVRKHLNRAVRRFVDYSRSFGQPVLR